jgi:hypothetical protein
MKKVEINHLKTNHQAPTAQAMANKSGNMFTIFLGGANWPLHYRGLPNE